MFKKGLLFGLGWFIAKCIVEKIIPEYAYIITSGCYTNLRKKYEAGEIKTLSEAINYIQNYDETDSNKTENKINNGIGF